MKKPIKRTVELSIPGREQVSLEIELNEANEIISSQLTVIGDMRFLEEASILRKCLTGIITDIELPKSKTPGGLLLKEALLKAQDKWDSPYCEPELCHCRGVPTEKVEKAILIGAHTPEEVSQQTSASTACGTCRPDVEALLKYRLG